MQKAECKTCPFFGHEDERYDDHHFGTCRVNPPTPVMQRAGFTHGVFGAWPWVKRHDWCGHHPLLKEFRCCPTSGTAPTPKATHIVFGPVSREPDPRAG